MSKLLWVGSPFFAKDMARCGWDVRLHNFEHAAVLNWQDLVKIADGPPEVLVVADKSRPPFVTGMERFPCLTVFYCVDSHIHSYYPYYAQGFDVCLVSLKDHIPRFRNMELTNERIMHCPPFAKDFDLPPDPGAYEAEDLSVLLAAWPQRDWDLLFVGTINSENTPLRKEFMQALSRELPGFQVRRGAYRKLYPKARLLLNHCELGDLNFRVFEALGCGGALLTPLVGHGLTEMFEPEKDLFLYEMNNYADAALKVRKLLDNPERCLAAAKSGFARVNACHRAIHRAEALNRHLLGLAASSVSDMRPCGKSGIDYRGVIQPRLSRAGEIHRKYLRFMYLLFAENMPQSALRAAYLQAARS